MASRRRSLEEKNLKTLRELAAFTANKQCFDCNQRGPTYINMTIGSFVCTSCSGILRGLTPPHRVKSITMTMFTPEEIEFLKSRGNEYCKYVWLGTYDSRTSNIENEGKDEHRKRDMMVQKYEKKRWYVDPEIAIRKMQHDYDQPSYQQQRQAVTTTTVITTSTATIPRQYSSTKVPEVLPLSQLLGKSPTPIVVRNNQNADKWPHPVSSASANPAITTTRSSSQSQGTLDLLSEYGSAAVTSPSSSQGAWTSNENFANFETAFSDDKKEALLSSSNATVQSLPPFQSRNNRKTATYMPPSGWTSFDDDLDPLSPSAATVRSSTAAPGISASSSANSVSSCVVSGAPTCAAVMPRPLSLPAFTHTNPFKTIPAGNTMVVCTQWQSLAANPGITTMLASISLDAYPMSSKEGAATQTSSMQQPPTVSSAGLAAANKQAQEDRYAALADLDSCFNQSSSSVTSPSWSVNSVTTSANTPVAASNTFSFPSTDSSGSNYFTTAPSNPFATSTTSLWGTPGLPYYNSVNPFQSTTESCLPYQQPQINRVFAPLPVVGNSPSEDALRSHFTTSTTGTVPLTAMHSGNVASPPNGFHGQMFGVQNGDVVTSPTNRTNLWGLPPSSSMPFPASQLTHSNSAHLEKQSSEHVQYSDWSVGAANPFMVSSSNMGVSPTPKPAGSSSNPFL